MPGLKRTSDPAVEPVTRAEMKTWLRLDDDMTADDDLIDDLIAQARDIIEERVDLALITQTWEYMLDATEIAGSSSIYERAERGWPLLVPMPGERSYIDLPRPPLQSVTSVVTYDTDDAESTFAASKYLVDTYGYPVRRGRVALNFGETWPTDLRTHNAMKITFVAGFGDAASAVHARIVLALKTIVAARYEGRGDEMPVDAERLVQTYGATMV